MADLKLWWHSIILCRILKEYYYYQTLHTHLSRENN